MASRPAASRGPLHTATAGAAGGLGLHADRVVRAPGQGGEDGGACADDDGRGEDCSTGDLRRTRGTQTHQLSPASSRSVVVAVVASVTRRAG